MREQDTRTALLLGESGVEKLHTSRVAVFGLGGVGGFCAEALARAGVGHLTLVDKDIVEESNLNRQLVALTSTVGKCKTDVMRARIAEIDPECEVTAQALFYLPETAHLVPLAGYDYVADCIDNVTAKLHLIAAARAANVPVISAMGAGNKLDPTRFEVADIYQTSVCPLARVMRRELKARGVKRLKVVYSKEEPQRIPPERYALAEGDRKGTAGRPVPASISFVPPVAGMILAGEVIKDIALAR